MFPLAFATSFIYLKGSETEKYTQTHTPHNLQSGGLLLEFPPQPGLDQAKVRN